MACHTHMPHTHTTHAHHTPMHQYGTCRPKEATFALGVFNMDDMYMMMMMPHDLIVLSIFNNVVKFISSLLSL